MKLFLIGLLLFATTLDAGYAAVSIPENLIDSTMPKCDNPDTIIYGFLKAVDHGDLVIFDRKLDRTMIIPTRVEYVHELSKRTTRVKIFSNLKEPMTVPSQIDFQVSEVAVVMEGGKIIQTESHVMLKQKAL